MMQKQMIRISCILLVVFMNISCDQVTKKEVRSKMDMNQIIHVVDSNFILKKIENTGAALGLGENLPPAYKTVLLKLLPAAILLFLLGYILINQGLSMTRLLAFSFIVGGGIGNIIDRIRFDSVTDFMYLEIGWLHTGIFNMADVSVTVGTAIILIESIFRNRYENLEVGK